MRTSLDDSTPAWRARCQLAQRASGSQELRPEGLRYTGGVFYIDGIGPKRRHNRRTAFNLQLVRRGICLKH
jgi:hypothetical protein